MSDTVVWTAGAVVRELQHLLCCSPDGRPCALRRQAAETVPGRRTSTEWSAFQLAAHARADVLTAMGELWPGTAGLDWEHLPDDLAAALLPRVQGLWCVIVRGPGEEQGRGPRLPAGQRPASRFGFLPWDEAARVLHRDRRAIQADAGAAIASITAWLSPWQDVNVSLERAWAGFACTPKIHTFSIGGEPHPDARCRCGRMTWSNWQRTREAHVLELRNR